MKRRSIATQEAAQLASAAAAAKDPLFDAGAAPPDFTVDKEHPPFEEQLLGATLWPEVCHFGSRLCAGTC